jgi:hypothetical protein
MVNPDGKMLIPTFAPQIRERGYMVAFMDWTLIYRHQYDISRLPARIEPAQIRSPEIYSDPTGSMAYLLMKKAAKVKTSNR